MPWNWRRPDWPDFTWDHDRMAPMEARFLLDAGAFAGVLRHLGQADTGDLTIASLGEEGTATSAIEGDILDRDSVQSSIRRQLGLGGDTRRTGAAEQGIAEMIVDLHRSFAAPLTNQMLFGWHRMVTNGRRDLVDIGHYWRDASPMQVVSGPLHAPHVHFEAPPADIVPDEMARFLAWFNRTAPAGPSPLPALTRAGIAHLYFVCIHPFEDGNGRIGRAIAEKALAQNLDRPTLMALAAAILARRRGYYDALAVANKAIDLTDWLVWFATTAMAAQDRATGLAEFLIEKTRLLDRMRGVLNARQMKALLRVLREGPGGFKGGLSAGNYAAITGASAATATRDLADMVEKGALVRMGERRHARYWAPGTSPFAAEKR